MKIIGLAGGSGSGKGTVAELFLTHYGIHSIDTDALYHSLTSQKSECLDALASEFGEEIISSDGALDRAALSRIVFFGDNADERRKRLNEISHYFVLAETRAMIDERRECGDFAVLVDAPLLFESGFDKECDAVISVIADRETRIDRIIKRDAITRDRAEKRIDSQVSDEFLREHSDFIIENNSNTTALLTEISSVVKILKNN